jgi:hypothetical protein
MGTMAWIPVRDRCGGTFRLALAGDRDLPVNSGGGSILRFEDIELPEGREEQQETKD